MVNHLNNESVGMPTDGVSKQSVAVHALIRGGITFVAVLVLGYGFRTLFSNPVSVRLLVEAFGVALLVGLVVAGFWYWVVSGGSLGIR